MPGLIGFVNNSDKNNNYPVLDRMIQYAVMEDWYRVDRHADNRCGVARVHLNIFNAYSQPVFNNDRTVCVSLHGEIYDYGNLIQMLADDYVLKTHNDAEILLKLYETMGDAFVEELNGSFVFAIWNGPGKCLTLANDRYGLRPLYYTRLNDQFIYSSEVKPITKYQGFKKAVNLHAISHLLGFGSMLGEDTLFENIHLMPAGSVMHFSNGELTTRKYWDYEYNEDYPTRSVSDYCEEFNCLYEQAVRRQSIGDYKIGVPLSGGLDSRVVCGYLHKNNQSFSTHTYGYRGCEDIRIAMKVAKVLDVDHHCYETDGEYIPEHCLDSLRLTNGMLDICDTQQIVLSLNLQDRCDVLNIGYAADLIFGGSYLSDGHINEVAGDKICDHIYNSFNYFVGDPLQEKLFRPRVYGVIKGSSVEVIRRRLTGTNARLRENKSDYVYLHERVKRFTMNANLVLLNKRLEYRTPPFDNNLMDFALRIPPDLRRNSVLYKELIKRYFPKLARIRWQKDGLPLHYGKLRRRVEGRLKHSIRYRAKHAFGGRLAKYVPNEHWHDLQKWTSVSHKDFFLSILLDKKTVNRPYFNQQYIRGNIIEPHMSGEQNMWPAISILTTFELWHRYIFDE